MKILALDTATKTGWCLYDKKIIESGTQNFTKRRGESNGLMFLRFRNWLTEMVTSHKPEMLVYEQAHHRGGAATEICVNLTGRVQEIGDEYNLHVANVRTTTLKLFATGKGNAGKTAMIAVAKNILGRDPIDDNEADAICLALWADNEYSCV